MRALNIVAATAAALCWLGCGGEETTDAGSDAPAGAAVEAPAAPSAGDTMSTGPCGMEKDLQAAAQKKLDELLGQGGQDGDPAVDRARADLHSAQEMLRACEG